MSRELTELRTVLSRSKTAYDTIRTYPQTWEYQHSDQCHTTDERIKMLGDLAMVIKYLEKYEGTRLSRGQRWRRGTAH